MPLFGEMDIKWLKVLCDRLKATIYTSGSQIVLKGDAIEEILLIVRGELTMKIIDEETPMFCSTSLQAGDFCGQELIAWAMDPNCSKAKYPFSIKTIETRSEVEAYALMADDLKHVFSQIRHTFDINRLRYVYR